jgi:hypothetical protein
MIATIAIMSIALVMCCIHIYKINVELNKISEEQSRQNEDIRNLMVAHMSLLNAIRAAAEMEQVKDEMKIHNYSGIKGEA